MIKDNLRQEISKLDERYEEVMEKINHLKADGNLSKLYNLKTTFDETFDYFFDDEDLRKKYNDWDYEEDKMLLDKTNEELLVELKDEDLEEYIEFFQEYIDNLEVELRELKNKEEKEMLYSILNELEGLVGQEYTLLEMDNEIKEIIEAVGDDKNSIFDGEIEDFIERGEYAYSVWEDEEKINTRDINIKFKVIEDNEDSFEVIVEIIEIELL